MYICWKYVVSMKTIFIPMPKILKTPTYDSVAKAFVLVSRFFNLSFAVLAMEIAKDGWKTTAFTISRKSGRCGN